MRSVRRPLLPLVLLLVLPACQHWTGRPLPSTGPSARQVPSPARVTMADGSSVVLWHGSVERDSLIGLFGARSGERERFAVPVAQVRRMDARGVDVLATGVSALGVLSTVAAMLFYQKGDW